MNDLSSSNLFIRNIYLLITNYVAPIISEIILNDDTSDTDFSPSQKPKPQEAAQNIKVYGSNKSATKKKDDNDDVYVTFFNYFLDF